MPNPHGRTGAKMLEDTKDSLRNKIEDLQAALIRSERRRLSDSTVTGNSQGIAIITGATLETRGNNTVRGNRIDVLGSPLTPVGGL